MSKELKKFIELSSGAEKPPLTQFKELLKGWMTSPDGDDYCPERWPQYLKRTDPVQKMAEEDSVPTSRIENLKKLRKCSDGLLTFCTDCRKEIFIKKENI